MQGRLAAQAERGSVGERVAVGLDGQPVDGDAAAFARSFEYDAERREGDGATEVDGEAGELEAIRPLLFDDVR